LLKTFRLPFCLTVFSSHLGHNCKQPLISQAPDDNLTGGASVCGNRRGERGFDLRQGRPEKGGRSVWQTEWLVDWLSEWLQWRLLWVGLFVWSSVCGRARHWKKFTHSFNSQIEKDFVKCVFWLLFEIYVISNGTSLRMSNIL